MKKTSPPLPAHSQSLSSPTTSLWAGIALGLLLLVGLVLRFYKLGEIPSILNRDEAALAYNAYLLSEVGHDEWQRSWPYALESFGDYKLPGYVLAVVAVFRVLPLTDLAVRLPSAVAGVVMIAKVLS